MYYQGNFYPAGVTGGGIFDYTLGYGINGQAILTGLDYFEPYSQTFEQAIVPAPAGGWGAGVLNVYDPGGFTDVEAKGINANDELAGFYDSSACGDTVSQCGFEWSGGTFLTVLQYGTDANVAEGLNDFAEIVGPYTDSITGYSHGLLWTHQ